MRVSSTVGRLPLSRERVAAIGARVLAGERTRAALLTVTFVGDREMARLNWRHLGHRGPTDIITFQHAQVAPAAPVVGDVYIAAQLARRNAAAAGCSWREELARLTVHGVLHALGWDHPEGEERLRAPMWRRQERWVARLRQAGAW
ncbi:MAG: rRNA maturation RNase YbeY [Gemmatimonadaceae bacterium]|nr:rRNA maturation RNase YbeY [Gemmatimonadaceae bacterium]